MMEAGTPVVGPSQPGAPLSRRVRGTVRPRGKLVQTGRVRAQALLLTSRPRPGLLGGREDRAPWVGGLSRQHLLPGASCLWTGNRPGGRAGSRRPSLAPLPGFPDGIRVQVGRVFQVLPGAARPEMWAQVTKVT